MQPIDSTLPGSVRGMANLKDGTMTVPPSVPSTDS